MDEEAVRAIIENLTAGRTIEGENGRQHMLLPPGWDRRTDQIGEPSYIEEQVSFSRLDSFIAYLKRFKQGATSVFIADDIVEAVIDYHGLMEPGLCAHKATYPLPLSDEWNGWTCADKRKVGQEAFAEMVDDRIRDFREPDGATMLEIAQTLKVDKQVTFKSQVSVSNGNIGLEYREDTDGTAGKARQITIPETFTLGIPVFQGGTLWEVKARLLWSVSGGNLQIGYKLQRPDLVYREAIDEIAETIEEAAEVYFGSR